MYRMTPCHNLTFSGKYLYRRCLASCTVIQRRLVFRMMNQEKIFLCYGKNSISHLHFKFSCISWYKQITLIVVCYVPFIPWSLLSLGWLKSPYTNEIPIPVGMSLWTQGCRLYGNMLVIGQVQNPCKISHSKSWLFYVTQCNHYLNALIFLLFFSLWCQQTLKYGNHISFKPKSLTHYPSSSL